METLTLMADMALKVLYVALPVALFVYLVVCSIDLYKYLSSNYPAPANETEDEDDSDLGIFMQ